MYFLAGISHTVITHDAIMAKQVFFFTLFTSSTSNIFHFANGVKEPTLLHLIRCNTLQKKILIFTLTIFLLRKIQINISYNITKSLLKAINYAIRESIHHLFQNIFIQCLKSENIKEI